MTQADWNYPTQIHVGPGRRVELADYCQSLKIQRPLIVTDRMLLGLPLVQEVLAALSAAGLAPGVFSEVNGNPTGSEVGAGCQAYRAGGHDGVLAIGGGSAMDVGKTIAVMAHQRCALFDLEDIGDQWQRADASVIQPIIAVPTTAGTGSEVGRAALIKETETTRKVIIFHPQMLPKIVLLDADFTVGLPPHLTAATGMDALSHLLEAYCSPVFHPMAEGIARQGMVIVRDYLIRAVANGADLEARTQMQIASMMGATAFQKGLGAMHALAHPLGAYHNAHHGLLNAILMPFVLQANRSVIEAPLASLARHLEVGSTYEDFLAWVLALRDEVGIPHRLTEAISETVDVPAIARAAILDPSAATNPIQFKAMDYERVLRAAMSGVVDSAAI
ncbi:iron-containing alcohol dehydrogenase [Pseudomonadales bacterium]|nr:iron-containing alcohol dehydrogenase [Pseudomonadales bacterium]MDC3330691.1 iron-containing alcohol dehydrogenase [Pseudomonadales bacterium]